MTSVQVPSLAVPPSDPTMVTVLQFSPLTLVDDAKLARASGAYLDVSWNRKSHEFDRVCLTLFNAFSRPLACKRQNYDSIRENVLRVKSAEP